uniref:NADH-quinone oxidoreductase subunit M n=1 Tax=Arsenophonus endosymbiont of Trialeurodes vaporariorum TaxID=235567 RepID=A0A3B0MJL7_9GAMM
MVFGVVFASIDALWMMQQVYYGTAKSEKALPALNGREVLVLLTLALLLVVLGFYPQPVLDTSKNVMESLHSLYSISFSTLRP